MYILDYLHKKKMMISLVQNSDVIIGRRDRAIFSDLVAKYAINNKMTLNLTAVLSVLLGC
jgi:hypothetical protein